MIRVTRRLFGQYESSLEDLIRKNLNANQVSVIDKSGGCGQSFQVIVRSKQFEGLPKIKQHKLVQDVLKDEIKKWHAISLDTAST